MILIYDIVINNKKKQAKSNVRLLDALFLQLRRRLVRIAHQVRQETTNDAVRQELQPDESTLPSSDHPTPAEQLLGHEPNR